MRNKHAISAYMNGRENNFNLLRMIAATLVLYFHSFPLSSGPSVQEPIGSFLKYGVGGIGVTIFFVMSGFLVTKSFDERRNIFLFIEARFLRIVPALAGVALFCVLIVGPCYTSLPLADFFWNSHTFRFLYTHMTVHRIEIELPGVFTRNIFPNAVNGSLWTLAYEISMYKWVAFLGLISVIRRRFTFSILFITWVLICLFVPPAYLVHNIQMRSLSVAFFSGAFLYVNRRIDSSDSPGTARACRIGGIIIFNGILWLRGRGRSRIRLSMVCLCTFRSDPSLQQDRGLFLRSLCLRVSRAAVYCGYHKRYWTNLHVFHRPCRGPVSRLPIVALYRKTNP